MFNLGSVVPRSSSQRTSITGDATGHSSLHNLSVDTALFPSLHEGGCGGYQPGDSLSLLLRQRIQQLFSPFTLLKEYLLVMF
jgi:hypothetical protein